MSGFFKDSKKTTPLIHLGIIMDGNGRWAQKKGLPRTAGHKEGLESAKKIVKTCAELNIKYVTLYTFSTENWKRTQDEVGYLMGLIKSHLRAEFEFYKKNNIKIEHIGDLSGLPKDVQEEIFKAREDTKHFEGLTVILAINYGGRDEIVRSVKKIAEKGYTPDKISEKLICDNFCAERAGRTVLKRNTVIRVRYTSAGSLENTMFLSVKKCKKLSRKLLNIF